MNLLTTITEQAAVKVHPDKNLVIDWSKALIKDAASNVEDEWVFWVPKLSQPQDRQNIELFISQRIKEIDSTRTQEEAKSKAVRTEDDVKMSVLSTL